MNRPEISIVLGSYDRRAFLKATIESVRDNGITAPYEIIVVDGGSTDGSLAWLQRQKDIITIVQHNRGTFRGKRIPRRSWGYFMNLGFKCAQGEYILMISDDCLLVPGAAMSGLSLFKTQQSAGKNIGAVAFYWRNWPGQNRYWVGLTLGGRMFVNHGMFLRQAVEQVGWIDEERYQFYHADGDLCLKFWERGYQVIDCPDAFVEHFNHANYRVRRTNSSLQAADWETYLSRWCGVFYRPDRPDIGGCIDRQYVDPDNTANRFPRWAVILLLAKQRIGTLPRKLATQFGRPRQHGEAPGS